MTHTERRSTPHENVRRYKIAVDLDGTLAEYFGWTGNDVIGRPIKQMVERVSRWLEEGHEVVIFTARASDAEFATKVKAAIEDWCKQHIGRVLEITNIKSYDIDELWDDRAVCVQANTGRPLSPSRRGLV